MLIKCPKGFYHLKHNFRDAFDENQFVEKYIEECFDNDSYIVGDITAGILRLKGFNNDPKSPNYFGLIDKYLNDSCVIGSPYFILKRITENEYNVLLNDNDKNQTKTNGFVITPIEKENFDKESLVLNTTPKTKANIQIDMAKINSIPKGFLPDSLKDDEKDKSNNKAQTVQPQVQTQTYVSSSNGFDPSKVQNRNNHNNNNRNDKNQNRKHGKHKR